MTKETQRIDSGLRIKWLLLLVAIALSFLTSAYLSLSFLKSYLEQIIKNHITHHWTQFDAQWQFGAIMLPIPFVLGVVSMLIARFTDAELKKPLTIAATFCVIVPIILSLLVWFRIY